ncbi:MAG: YciI family protein [Actinomycetota bacterium]
MRYALLIYADESSWGDASEEDRRVGYQRYSEYGRWLGDQGWIRGGDQLASSASATCVRVEDGRTVTTDGPYAETTEQLGGFYLIETDDLDQAIEAASWLPAVERGTIEVRPIVEDG